jgi:phosphatidylethanolamine-binding protein (PEBP) family uncharacterized protein
MLSYLKRPSAIVGSSLVLILATAGCGSTATSSTTSKSPGVRFNGKASSIQLSSQFSGSTIPAAYTCDGHDKLPPLSWGALPAGTKQLALFILGFTRSGTNTQIQDRYAVAGLSPTLHGIEGKLPTGSIPGRASNHRTKYSLCPPRGTTENYLFLLYALPNKLHVHPGFNAIQLLGQISPTSSPSSFGAFIAAYSRQ